MCVEREVGVNHKDEICCAMVGWAEIFGARERKKIQNILTRRALPAAGAGHIERGAALFARDALLRHSKFATN